jgi:hypothetical protein
VAPFCASTELWCKILCSNFTRCWPVWMVSEIQTEKKQRQLTHLIIFESSHEIQFSTHACLRRYCTKMQRVTLITDF